MSDLISRQALLDWINKQREEITKKQVAGTDGSIFTREALVTMQRCISTFETAINNQPTAYDVDKVVEQLEEKILEIKDQLMYTHDEDMAVRLRCKMHGLDEAVEIVKGGGAE